MTTTFNRLKFTLAHNYQVFSASITLDATFKSLDMDSLDIAELLFNIEDEFDIVFPAEPERVPTVGDLVVYIDRLIAAQDDSDAQPYGRMGVIFQPF